MSWFIPVIIPIIAEKSSTSAYHLACLKWTFLSMLLSTLYSVTMFLSRTGRERWLVSVQVILFHGKCLQLKAQEQEMGKQLAAFGWLITYFIFSPKIHCTWPKGFLEVTLKCSKIRVCLMPILNWWARWYWKIYGLRYHNPKTLRVLSEG